MKSKFAYRRPCTYKICNCAHFSPNQIFTRTDRRRRKKTLQTLKMLSAIATLGTFTLS